MGRDMHHLWVIYDTIRQARIEGRRCYSSFCYDELIADSAECALAAACP